MRTIVYDHQIFSLQRFGGISRYFCELATRVDQAPGFQARVLGGIHFNTHLADADVPRSGAYVQMKVPRTGRLYRTANALLAPHLMRAAKPSLVHRTYYKAADARKSRVPAVVTVFDMIHELFAGSFPVKDTTSRDKRRSIDRADHVICISESTARDLTRLFGVAPERISVTHLGFSDTFSTVAADASDSSPHSRPYLLYVGQRAGYKNFELALRAYASSSTLHGEFDLMAFGGPPFNAGETALIGSLGLRPDSVFHRGGTDRELARAYRHARVFVYPSKYEGFGIPPLEAMASGCPVACADTSSLPEVVGNAAALFDPNDIDAIARAMARAGTDAELREHLVAAGHQQVAKFSWDRCATDTMAVYGKILART